MNQHVHVTSIRTNVIIFGILMLLLFATVGAAYLPLGPLHFPTAMTIAAIKAVVIALFFMHVIHSHRMTLAIFLASFFWLAIMILVMLVDYESRGWLKIPGK
jgi:cytochrome c oxidase subunit 4